MIVKTPRRALTHVGGATTVDGDERLGAMLAHAMDVPQGDTMADEDQVRPHLHSFHSYPARMHPVTASRLAYGLRDEVQAANPPARTKSKHIPGEARILTLLDPFCGSGTVLLEGALAGLSVVGTDLNPLAVDLCELKLSRPTTAQCTILEQACIATAAVAEERRKNRVGASMRYPQEDLEMFAPHVLLELDGIRVGISEQPIEVRRPLLLILSSLLTKLSRKSGDSSTGPLVTGQTEKRIAAGYPSKLFRKKCEEFLRRQQEFLALWTNPTETRVKRDDATALASVRNASIDMVITSPPYAATYDYVAHHALRLRWLGLSKERLELGEIGARRNYDRLRPDEAHQKWQDELTSMFEPLARVCKPGAYVALLMADSAVRGGALRADEEVLAAIDALPFVPIAKASQPRPHFHLSTQDAFRSGPRKEHVLLLQRQ